MSTTRFASAVFFSLVLGNLLAGCIAAGKPPGAYASNVECTSNLQCKFIAIPACTRNMKQCYEGHCLISDIPNCVVPVPAATATTPVAPVPTLSPTIEPSPTPPPGSNPTPVVPN
jgi:hypothetical protein